jgi:hypothetical protein
MWRDLAVAVHSGDWAEEVPSREDRNVCTAGVWPYLDIIWFFSSFLLTLNGSRLFTQWIAGS